MGPVPWMGRRRGIRSRLKLQRHTLPIDDRGELFARKRESLALTAMLEPIGVEA